MSDRTIFIGNRPVGDSCPCYIIAEAGVNHNGDLTIAKQMVDVAVDARADAIKFQMRHFDALYTEGTLQDLRSADLGVQYILSLIKDNELSRDGFLALKEYCDKRGITFLCSPWDLKSVDFLEEMNVPAYKVASADMTNLELLEHIAKKKKPILVSTGMSTMPEIEKTVGFLQDLKAQFILLHCNSTYPAPFKDLNLRFIRTIKKKFGCLVGYSGHELGIAVSEAAVVMGARVVERHFTLDRTMKGPDHAMSLEPVGLKKIVRDIRNIETAMGSKIRYLTQGEYINRVTLGKSLVSTQEIKEGETIERHMVAVKSPGSGLSPQRIYDLVGTRARRNISANEVFTEFDLDDTKRASREFSSLYRWGVIVRYHDLEKIISGGDPPVLEFHLSSKDIEHQPEIPFFPDKEAVIHVPELWGDQLLDLCSMEPRVRQQSIHNLARALDVARRIRGSFGKTPDRIKVNVHVGGMSYGEPVKDNRYMYEKLGKSLAQLNQSGVDILLENLPPFPWYKGGQWFSNVFVDANEIVDFCRQHQYQICYDTSHAQLYCNWAGVDHIAYFRKLQNLCRHLHISDGAGVDGEGLQIGEGNVDFRKLSPLLIATRASFVPEIWMGHRDNGEGFWKALHRLKEFGF